MRVRIMVLLAACIVTVATVAWADNTFEGFQIVRVIFNQQEVVSDVPAVNFFGRTMLPVRKLAELAGLAVDRWDAETNTVYLSGGDKQPVATINGEPITRLDLYNRMVAKTGAAELENLIQERLVDQAARQAGITVTTADVDRAIEKIKQRVGGEAQFQDALRANSISLEELRSYQVFRLKVEKLLEPAIPVTDEVLRKYFAENAGQFDTHKVHARHILVATEQEAKAVKAELDKGADFAALAKEKSTDPSARTNGGDLGTFGRDQMVPEFDRVVFSLGKGQISEPFQSPFGWHVAQVVEISGTAPDFEAMKADVRAAYIESEVAQRAAAFLEGLKARARITNTLK